MKTFTKLSLFMALAGMASFSFATNLVPATGEVQFTGKVIDAACKIPATAITKELPTIPLSAINDHPTDIQGESAFTIDLTECGTAEVTLTLSNFKDKSGENLKNLKNTATGSTAAKNVSVAVSYAKITTSTTAAPTNYDPIDFSNSPSLDTVAKTDTSNVMNKLYFKAGYIQNGSTATAGEVKAGFTFNIAYK